MRSPVRRIARWLRFGRPVVIVSGLPRSGTSMMMRMLEAGGVPLVTDAARAADESNPHGYFELERVLTLDKPGSMAWLAGARGHAVKVISALLPHLPETSAYKVLFMRRGLHEVVASQRAMLERQGRPATGTIDADMVELYRSHLAQIGNLLSRRSCFDVLDVEYSRVIDNPEHEARRIAAFLGRRLDTSKMAAAVDPQLYRHRLGD